MELLNNRDIAPPEISGGDSFRYTHAETGHRSVGADYYTWQDRIRDHRKANNLPAITSAQAEDQLCKQLPAEWCHGEDPNRPRVETRMSLGDVWDAMRVFGKFAIGGFQFVSQDEANRRARICAGCYNNISVQGCGACQQLGEMVTGGLAQRSTASDAALKVCAVCRCLNRAQAHIPMEALDAKDSPDKQALYPNFCWLKAGGENFLLA